MFDDIQQSIEDANVSFPKFGRGVELPAIAEAEARLGIPLSESYKWWLLNYGGGQIGGDVIYGLDEPEMGRPDIVRLALDNQANRTFGLERLTFAIGNEEDFYFDTTEGPDHTGEYKVYLQEYGQEPFLYADSFAEFLRRRIREVYRI